MLTAIFGFFACPVCVDFLLVLDWHTRKLPLLFRAMCRIEQNKFRSYAIVQRATLATTEQEEFRDCTLDDVKKELAKPRMAQSARHAMSRREWSPINP